MNAELISNKTSSARRSGESNNRKFILCIGASKSGTTWFYHFLKNQPKAIPYITSYYKRKWGFCISYNEYKIIDKRYSSSDKFKVVINSSLNKKGNLNYGELVLKGKSKKEILPLSILLQ